MTSFNADIDWAMLREQKRVLLDLAERHPILDGVIELIDCIQGQAAEAGEPVLWLEEVCDAND